MKKNSEVRIQESESRGSLRDVYSIEQRSGRQNRRLYQATDLGKMTLEDAKEKVQELFGELFKEL
ncbi:MAG TPA: hypothetical protein VE944_31445 [Nostoc sp.]|uniref:hypothetical protein n=1 Tax=Nostoc sp. TaxID=1180 RepID=UPI002D6CB90F|nr:hypothetical protein [Nostoc sp.]HYX18807.1 hypothetical protein [Nostoc sp.]